MARLALPAPSAIDHADLAGIFALTQQLGKLGHSRAEMLEPLLLADAMHQQQPDPLAGLRLPAHKLPSPDPAVTKEWLPDRSYGRA